MSKNILVTGGAGYIGSHACKALYQAGFTPITLDNLVFGHESAVRWGPLVRGDLSDEALVRDTLRSYRIQAVIHFAAFAYVGESMQDPGKYFANNVGGTIALLNAMRAEGVRRIVFSSTCATYGIPDCTPIGEDHPQRPVNPYGESKRMVEQLLRWFDEVHEMRYIALRYFNAAGADADGELGEDHDPETHLIPLVIDAALGRRASVSIFGTDYDTPDGTAVRDYIHVADLASAHVAALDHLLGGGSSACLNLGTGRGHSVRDVIRMVETVSGLTVPVSEQPRRAGDPPALVAGASSARHLLGWEPQHSDLLTIISTAWQWHCSQLEPAVAAASAA